MGGNQSQDVILYGICTHPGMQKELGAKLSIRHKWRSKLYHESTPLSLIPCTCKNDTQPAARKLLPTINHNNVIVYNNCARTLFAAMRRQLKAVPLPKYEVITEYRKFCESFFCDKIEPILRDFKYNPADWYNHLNVKQQAEILDDFKIKVKPNKWVDIQNTADRELVPEPQQYSMFCKREVQIIQDGLPKNRAISAPRGRDKYIMGPITWKLEDIFDRFLLGYCGKKNWNTMENDIHKYYKQGYRYVAYGDGSGWDLTQSHELKYIDRLIYRFLADKIKHTTPEIFLKAALSRFRTIKGSANIGKSMKTLFEAVLDATVTSGSNDTTLMNTLRMVVILEFIMSKTQLDYRIWAKGDDFIIFLKDQVDLTKLFYKYWSPKDTNLNEEFGLGIVLKFLKVGPITDFDFCSTNVIKDDDVFKIVRLPNRMYPLQHWSIKALQYSRDELITYMQDIALGLEDWVGDMPFYSDYAKLIRKVYRGTGKTINNVGASKNLLQDGIQPDKKTLSIIERGYDYYHSQMLRKSDNKVSSDAVYSFLLTKYGITKLDIDYHFDQMTRLGVYDEVNFGFQTLT